MNQTTPTILILFGATGDLASKKILPALFELHKNDKLSQDFTIVGVARRYNSDSEFHDHVRSVLPQDEQLNSFLTRISFHNGDVTNLQDFKTLHNKLGELDAPTGVCSNKLFYLSLTPQFYQQVFENIAQSGLARTCSDEEGWTRVIVEKPFGRNLETAQELEELLSNLFKEEQIYRIDHYLGKDALQNILAFRFTNNVFESSWNNKFIEKIEIKALETIDVGSRGDFYDGVGALRDVGQNHLLQMLALVAMDNPLEYSAERVREMRSRVFEDLHILSEKEIKEKTIRAQYEGYTQTEGVAQNSQTETYFRVEAEIRNERWQGVPIVMESGKALENDIKEIVVTFKKPSHQICDIETSNGGTNKIIFSISPKEEIEIHIYAKKPELGFVAHDRKFTIPYNATSDQIKSAQEYQQLLLDVIDGNQTSFVSTEEVTAMWRFVDPIIHAWMANKVEMKTYTKGTKP